MKKAAAKTKKKAPAKKSVPKKAVPVTHQINAKALQILAKHPKGVRWSELQKKIKAGKTTFHPKTVNGIVWQLVERNPDMVYKPEKGLFRLKKFK